MIKFKLITSIALFLILNICNGQKNESLLQQSINSEKKSEENKPVNTNNEQSLFYSDFKSQISQVVRTIFQDSRGNIWFGTQDGAFKFDGNLLIHIDSVISETGKDVTIKDITQSNDGKIWLGHTAGVSCIDGNTVTNYYETVD